MKDDPTPLPSLYDLLKPVLPRDHSRQSTALQEVQERIKAGFRPLDILDLGCGTGRTLDFFRGATPDARWTGVDIETSPEVLQRTRSDATFITFDGVNLPFETGQFDLVYSHQVFEHVRHPEPLLGEAQRVLAEKGLLVGQTSQMEPYHSFSFWNYTVYGFKALLETAGFELLLMRPGIDSLTLINRAINGRPKSWSKWFEEETPFNQKLQKDAEDQGRPTEIKNYRKLIYCGQFVFVAKPKRRKQT